MRQDGLLGGVLARHALVGGGRIAEGTFLLHASLSQNGHRPLQMKLVRTHCEAFRIFRELTSDMVHTCLAYLKRYQCGAEMISADLLDDRSPLAFLMVADIIESIHQILPSLLLRRSDDMGCK